MAYLDDPAISLSKKTNEQNIAACKAWMQNVSYLLNSVIPNMENKITNLEARIKQLEGGQS